MSLSEPFIRRPIATALLTLAVVLSGMLAYVRLPIAPLPDVAFPSIVVSAQLSGANPQTMASTVATPLERSLGQIAGINQMSSSSSRGTTRITIQFDLDKDVNEAAREVQAAINRAEPLLPSAMTSSPTYRKLNPSSAPIMILALTSDAISQGERYNLADDVIAPRIAQVEGVGDVNVGGSSSPAVRVDLDPRSLEHAGLALGDVRQAITAANSNRPKGFIDGERHRFMLDSNSQLFEASDYRQLILRSDDSGHVLRLGDVARVTNGVEDEQRIGFLNHQPAVLLVISASAGANIIRTIEGIRDRMPAIEQALPGDAHLDVVLDRSPGIQASLNETQLTLILAVVLVVLVVFVFLRSGRATLIPCAAIPVSLIGTFGIMHLLGYSLDTLSLMALVVAIGFIVDDAIVVVENIARHLERGEAPFQAALQGAREVGFTVLSMSLSLIAVFIPLLLLGGLIGRLFHEFAMTLAIAIMVSLLISLTLTPMLCARWLRVTDERQHTPLWKRIIERSGSLITRAYARSLDFSLRHRRLTLLSLIAVIVLNGYLYTAIDKGFVPDQDTGRLLGFARGDQSLSFQAMSHKLDHMRDRLLADPDVNRVLGFIGGGRDGSSSEATLFITLKDNRSANTSATANRLSAMFRDTAGLNVFMFGLQDLRAGSHDSSSGQYELTLKSDDLALLRKWEPRVTQALRGLDDITGVDSDSRTSGQAMMVVVDRDKASRLGVNMQAVDEVLQNSFSQRKVSSVYQGTNQYYVVMEVGKAWQNSPQALQGIHVIDGDGERIPLSAIAHLKRSTTPVSVQHEGQFAATTISFNTVTGVTLDQATTAISRQLDELNLPIDIQADFGGSAASFQSGVAAMPWLILAALLAVYLVLGILYESYIHPLTILSTLPSAGIGALLALMLLNKPFTLIALIGIILLIGVVKKNAIMLVDFALDAERSRALSAREAIYEAAMVRFRPIMMTTLAAILGAIPLTLGTDENAALRAPLGISIIGGLLVSQLLTLYTTPVVYLYLDRLRRR
ncbi:efflux RND transporter permease subunit [Kushneria phosphatilytica]|uniref:MMPL family transporter n=1 Tax=Kushneria phosphatilytica TaxID=657387 RepID=A0A1S1NY49_9GAMM|nr:efflux RND transporter permease subunit [Kushneria phosphatilytica]OHV12296.1 multidrug transporter subunit MdtC [Kushneria phosphatilytica]QEL11501.1 MMPL family transporter [Kushneria phosphatilytica]